MLMPHRHRPRASIVAVLAVGGMMFTKLPLLVVLLNLAQAALGRT
jgi:hypothetical protein